MKFFLSSLFLFFGLGVFAQGGPSCCAMASANGEFASLTADRNFVDVHQTPRMDTLENPLGKLIGIPTPTDTVNTRAYGYFITATEPTDKVILVFHEWWGLNDNIKREADRYFEALDGKAHVMAVDLYDYKKATTREKAAELMEKASEERIGHILQGAFALAGPDAKFATLGWCFGGTWALQAAIEGGDRVLACVKYYGMPEKDTERLAQLEAPVLGIFAKQDGWISPAVAAEFESNMEKLEKELTVEHYDADHAFANPSNPQYNEEMTEDAFQKSVSFLKSQLFD
jgi:carboxymethylenebutenolidase